MNYRTADNRNLTRAEVKELKREQAEERNAKSTPESRKANRKAKQEGAL